ncbi:MAG: Rieske (2Fe-2S) protein [Pseudohongiellaceae bacterium]
MNTLIAADDIAEGASRGIEVDGQYLFAVKKQGQIYLYWNHCPHLGTPLDWEAHKFLDPDGRLIQCSTHGALFQIEDGRCIAGPCKGKHLQAVPFTLVDGMVMVDNSQFRRLKA